MTKTKIICTIGPSVHSYEKIVELIHAGMDVARLNFSHGTHHEHKESIDLLKKARKATGKPLAIMLDTKGPEIRLGKVRKGGVDVTAGMRLWLVKELVEGNNERISLLPSAVLDAVTKGTKVLIDNGYISSTVIDVQEHGILIEIENNGHITSSKSVSIPNVSHALAPLTETDIADIRFGCEQDVDCIAVSFVYSPETILTIKKLIAEEKKPDIYLIAKIECNEGVHNFDSILQVSDGIMIARGDLGVAVPLSHLPRLQKMMIRKSYLLGKPSVTATQMLESMIHNPRPTRAEVSDVANAIHDSTSAVMLSGETAIGKYPIETVQMMKSIIHEAEQDFNYHGLFDAHTRLVYGDVPSGVTLAGVKTAYTLGAKAIITLTHSGTTARLLSRLRPKIPIIALTPNIKTYHQLALHWGVIPVLCKDFRSIEEAFKEASQFALANHLVSYGDLVVITAGAPFWVSGTTNMIVVESIGDVLVRGHGGYGQKIHGNVTFVHSPESKQPYAVRNQIIVLTSFTEEHVPLAREASGIILQNINDDSESERQAILIAKTLQKPLIVRADGAFRILREGQLVTLDPDRGLIYKGVSV